MMLDTSGFFENDLGVPLEGEMLSSQLNSQDLAPVGSSNGNLGMQQLGKHGSATSL